MVPYTLGSGYTYQVNGAAAVNVHLAALEQSVAALRVRVDGLVFCTMFGFGPRPDVGKGLGQAAGLVEDLVRQFDAEVGGS